MTAGERHLRITGVLEQVETACEFVVAQARVFGLEERAIHHCYLAVDEACTNIIEHGYADDCGECAIDLFCKASGQVFTITIVDDSSQFDPLERPDPDPHAPLSERGSGGWGIFFIKKLMDDVSYSFEEGRNRLVMVKKRGKGTQPLTRESASLQSIETKPLSEHVWLITPRGRLEGSQTRQLASALTEQIDSGHRWLIVNMAGIDYVSSAGLKMLVSAWQRAREIKGDVVLVGLVPRVREIVQLIGLDLVFTITETTEQARTYVASKAK